MVLLSIKSPSLSSPSSSLSSFKPSPLPSSSSQDSHDDPTKLPLFSSSFSPVDHPEMKRRVIITHVNQRKPKEDRKEEEPKSTPQTKGSDVVKERGGVSCSDVGDNKEREGKEGKKKKDGSSVLKKPKLNADTEPKVGFKNPLFSHGPKPLPLKTKAAAAEETEKKPEFSVTLPKEEIEADFFAVTQSKKMPKNMQRLNHKEIKRLFPGSTLSEITTDTYRVKGFPPGSRK